MKMYLWFTFCLVLGLILAFLPTRSLTETRRADIEEVKNNCLHGNGILTITYTASVFDTSLSIACTYQKVQQ